MKYNLKNMGYDEINDKFTCPEWKELEYVKKDMIKQKQDLFKRIEFINVQAVAIVHIKVNVQNTKKLSNTV